MRIALKPGIPGQYDDHVQQNHASHQLWMASDCILIEMKCPIKLTFRNYKKVFCYFKTCTFYGQRFYRCQICLSTSLFVCNGPFAIHTFLVNPLQFNQFLSKKSYSKSSFFLLFFTLLFYSLLHVNNTQFFSLLNKFLIKCTDSIKTR